MAWFKDSRSYAVAAQRPAFTGHPSLSGVGQLEFLVPLINTAAQVGSSYVQAGFQEQLAQEQAKLQAQLLQQQQAFALAQQAQAQQNSVALARSASAQAASGSIPNWVYPAAGIGAGGLAYLMLR